MHISKRKRNVDGLYVFLNKKRLQLADAEQKIALIELEARIE